MMTKSPPLTASSRAGLYGANFFLTEMIGVVAPFLSVFLHRQGWGYDSVGMAAAAGGLGMLFLQIPAGLIADALSRRRMLLAVACLISGSAYAALPGIYAHAWAVYLALFLAGAATAFFVPLLATLALSLSGPRGFDHMMGVNQGWSHFGNIAAAGIALVSQRYFGISSVFYTVAVVCLFATISLFLIRNRELKPITAEPPRAVTGTWLHDIGHLLKDRRVLALIASVALFQLANAPAMPLAALYMQHLEGSEAHTAFVVLLAQTVMVPVSLIGAACATRFGRKPVFAVAFITLPLRLFLFSRCDTPLAVILVQGLDGLCAGIYDVVICLICADLTRKRAGFNTLVSIMQATVALGYFGGPLLQGEITEHLGFPLTFLALAGIATAGAAAFFLFMPETGKAEQPLDAAGAAA